MIIRAICSRNRKLKKRKKIQMKRCYFGWCMYVEAVWLKKNEVIAKASAKQEEPVSWYQPTKLHTFGLENESECTQIDRSTKRIQDTSIVHMCNVIGLSLEWTKWNEIHFEHQKSPHNCIECVKWLNSICYTILMNISVAFPFFPCVRTSKMRSIFFVNLFFSE